MATNVCLQIMKGGEILSDAQGVCILHTPLFQADGERYRHEFLHSFFIFFQVSRPKGADMMSPPFQ